MADNQHKQVVIISVPYTDPLPIVAPVLLAACLERGGISAVGVDFGIHFIKQFVDKPWYTEFKNFLTIGYVVRPKFKPSVFKQVIGFTRDFLQDIIDKHNPTYIGLSIFTSESLDYAMILSYVVRKYFPHIKLIAGGKGLEVTDPTGVYHYQNWVDKHIVDTVVVGDAESEIIETIKHNKVGVVYSPKQTKEDLDSIPLAQWNSYDLSIYPEIQKKSGSTVVEESYLAITGSKGCVRQCTFCNVPDFWPEYLYRDPIKVAQEIIHNYQNTGIKRFRFTDNLINGSISNFRLMNEYLVKHLPRTVRYSGYAIFRGANQMPEEDFRLAAEAGNIHWAIGVESGSEKIRYDMKKKFTNDDIDWSTRMLYKYNIQQTWLLMVGYPSESEEDFNDTMQLLKNYAHFRDKISIQVTPTFMLLNNSPLIKNREVAEYYGLDHFTNSGNLENKFWVSTKFTDNNYPTRSRRWKQLVALIEELGYPFGDGMPVQKWRDEIENLDKVYHEQKSKIIAIHPC